MLARPPGFSKRIQSCARGDLGGATFLERIIENCAPERTTPSYHCSTQIRLAVSTHAFAEFCVRRIRAPSAPPCWRRSCPPPHHFHQSLIAGLALSDRPPDDDVAHRCESERLRDLHRKLPGRIMLDLLHGALRRALPSEQRRERHEAGDDQRDEGEPGHFWHGQCLHRK